MGDKMFILWFDDTKQVYELEAAVDFVDRIIEFEESPREMKEIARKIREHLLRLAMVIREWYPKFQFTHNGPLAEFNDYVNELGGPTRTAKDFE